MEPLKMRRCNQKYPTPRYAVFAPFLIISTYAQKALTFFPSTPIPGSAFLFPNTESGVLGIGMPAPLLYSSKQVAWYILPPTCNASIQTKSFASTFHCVSNFSWQIGQGACWSVGSCGTST